MPGMLLSLFKSHNWTVARLEVRGEARGQGRG